MLGAGLSARVGKAMAALLRWLALALALTLGWRSWEAATTAFLQLWRRLLRRASPGDTAPWPELPPELLGLVLSRLPSQVDRVRLCAVCRPWRSTPRPHPLPPPFPWIVLRDRTFLTLPYGALHRLPRHLCCGQVVVCCVSTGSTLFFGHLNGRCCLVNPCSGKTTSLKINLADYSTLKIYKLVLSHHIVAFQTKYKLTIIPRQGARHMTWEPPGNIYSSMLLPHDLDVIMDIAVFQRKLYVLTRKFYNTLPQQPDLHLLDINLEHNCVRSVRCISATQTNDMAPCLSAITGTRRLFFFYLVVSGDRLLVVERQIHMELANSTHGNPRPRPIRAMFEVLEAVDLIAGQGRWSKVDTLMGRALFVGRECSESLPAQCGARPDCIYFMTERNHFLPRVERKPDDDLLDCVVYNVRDRTMEPLAWEAEAGRDGPSHPTWLFPADV
ncbi:unnamed protein product [Alopecurus aequalis]